MKGCLFFNYNNQAMNADSLDTVRSKSPRFYPMLLSFDGMARPATLSKKLLVVIFSPYF